jgi:hypothetical protein
MDVKEIRQPIADRRCAPVSGAKPCVTMTDGDNTPRPVGASQDRHIARL